MFWLYGGLKLLFKSMNCQSADSWLVLSKFYILNSQSFSYTQCTLLKSAVFIFYLVTLFGCLPVLIRSYLFTILGTGMPNQSIWFVISLHDGNLMFLNSSLAWLTFQKHFHHNNYKTSFRKWNDWFHKINPMPYSLLPTKPWKKFGVDRSVARCPCAANIMPWKSGATIIWK